MEVVGLEIDSIVRQGNHQSQPLGTGMVLSASAGVPGTLGLRFSTEDKGYGCVAGVGTELVGRGGAKMAS